MFLPFAGMMYGSPAAERMASNGILSDGVRLGVGVTAYSKVSGVLLFCSFSSQEPDGYRATLSWFCRVWTSVWMRPS